MTTRTSGRLAVPSMRIPMPVVVPSPFGGFQMSCRTCPVRIAGLPTRDAAQRWAQRHQCPDDPGIRLENHAWNSQTRADNGELFRG